MNPIALILLVLLIVLLFGGGGHQFGYAGTPVYFGGLSVGMVIVLVLLVLLLIGRI